MYTMKQEKRKLCSCDYTRYLLVKLFDGRQNQNTHAYGHRDLAEEKHTVADISEPSARLIFRQPEELFDRRHA